MFKLINSFSVFLILLMSPTAAYSFLGCDEECSKCHSLNTAEVKNILTKIKNPDAKILKIQMSPVKGLWEVDVEDKGRKGLFYVDFSKQYIIRGPILDISGTIDKTKERVEELNKDRKVDRSRIPLKDALMLGDRYATKKVIIFTDPDCPFCGKLHKEIKKVVEKRKDIAFYIKLFPLTKLHPDSLWKSKTILCNKSLKFLEDNFDKKPIPKPACEAKEIAENIKLAESLGITGTPTTIMPDGSVHSGYLQADKLIEIVDSVKNKTGRKEGK
ncbi:MAG: DsbC family protein [Nitrospirae bacterium]|nr:DsbC family protein [Nitrospirota bacterium]